jgi:hypothetical protein
MLRAYTVGKFEGVADEPQVGGAREDERAVGLAAADGTFEPLGEHLPESREETERVRAVVFPSAEELIEPLSELSVRSLRGACARSRDAGDDEVCEVRRNSIWIPATRIQFQITGVVAQGAIRAFEAANDGGAESSNHVCGSPLRIIDYTLELLAGDDEAA